MEENVPPSIRPAAAPLLQEGWELFLRLQEPTANSTDLDHYERWKERSAAHLDVAREIEELWMSMDSLEDLPWPTAAELAEDSAAVPAVSSPGRRWAIGAALAASIVLATSYFLMPGSPIQYSTARGEHRMVNLPDGSELIMGAMSEVRVEYSATRRQLWQTRGVVLFTVAEDAARPFVVTTAAGSARAVGTAFNINASTEVAVISVVEGTIRVELAGDGSASGGSAGRSLSANQQISLGAGGIIEDVHPANSNDVLAWRAGRFVYSGTPLARVVEDINRYAETPVRLGDREVGELLFTGALQRTQFEIWLSALEASFPVKISKEGEAFVIHAAPGSP